MKFWYMDVTMDNGKGRYPLLTGTAGFESFSSFHFNKRPMARGEPEVVRAAMKAHFENLKRYSSA